MALATRLNLSSCLVFPRTKQNDGQPTDCLPTRSSAVETDKVWERKPSEWNSTMTLNCLILSNILIECFATSAQQCQTIYSFHVWSVWVIEVPIWGRSTSEGIENCRSTAWWSLVFFFFPVCKTYPDDAGDFERDVECDASDNIP